jgi:acyl-CoA thioesterase-1
MRSFSFLFVLVLWSAAATAGGSPAVLILGDSLSAAYGIPQDRGWVALLQRRLAERGLPHRIVNASVSGETTRGGLTRLPRLLEEHRPGLVVIELGANDGLRGIADRVLADNLRALVEMSKGSGARVLLLGIRLPPNYGAAFNARFDRVFDEVARETLTPLVPFFLKGVAEDRALMLPDGLHPAAEAQPIILENVWPALEPLLEAKG